MTIWYQGMPLPDKRLLPPSRRRIWELDFLRGVFILLMLMDHTFFDIAYMFGRPWMESGNEAAIRLVEASEYYWVHPARDWVHDVVLWGFFGLCGMSVAFSRNNCVHWAKIAACAVIISCGTMLAETWGVSEDITVRFGALHMLATGTLLVAIVYSLVYRNRTLHVLTFLALGVATYLVGVLCIDVREWPDEPIWLCIFSARMGDPFAFTPGDCFPLFGHMDEPAAFSQWLGVPFISRMFFGAAVVPLFYPYKRSLLPALDHAWHRPIGFVGRHTLLVVLLHQILIPVILGLVTGWVITPGNYGIV